MKPTYPCKLYYIFSRESKGVTATLIALLWLTDQQVKEEKIGSPNTFLVCADELKKCFATPEDVADANDYDSAAETKGFSKSIYNYWRD